MKIIGPDQNHLEINADRGRMSRLSIFTFCVIKCLTCSHRKLLPKSRSQFRNLVIFHRRARILATARVVKILWGVRRNKRVDSVYRQRRIKVAASEKTKILGWYPSVSAPDYEVIIDHDEKHSGTRCASLRSLVKEPRPFGNITQAFSPDEYIDHRLRMSAWVRTRLKSGTAQLWLRVDTGDDWKSNDVKPGKFDNMDDRPIEGDTDWTKYDLVVDVSQENTSIVFGLMLLGEGQIWLDDISFEKVDKDVPLTGTYAVSRCPRKLQPINLNFEE